ncbi:MAG: putative lipopolysaccharide heptosyltransferase III [Burkholderiales bacterium]
MATPRRALVVVPRRLGDVLLATPVMRSLKRAYPDCRVDALVFAGTEAILAGNPDVDAVLTIAERPTAGDHAALARRVFRRYDLALSLVPGDRSTLYAWCAGRQSAGLVVDEPKHAWKKALLGRWVPFDDRGTHTVAMHLRLIEALGIPPVPEVVASWRPADAEAARAALVAQGVTGAYAVLHPFPKFRYKQWPVANWAAVADWLRVRGLAVVLTGGPDPAERAFCADIAKQAPVANLAGALSLPATACVIAGARAYVGPDTATTHLAAALGVPTVALFGPTDPLKWGPWPRAHRTLDNPWRRVGSQRADNVALMQGTIACTPCLLEGCDRHVDSTADCLTHLPPRAVIAALEHFLTP